MFAIYTTIYMEFIHGSILIAKNIHL